jgi:general secretion pathway protein H
MMHRRAVPAASPTAGFTLLEMMVVLVVAALITGVAVPAFQPAIASMQLRSAAQDVASGLRHARGTALASGREQTFFLDLGKHSYTLSDRKKAYSLPSGVKLDLFTAEQELSAETQSGYIRFYPDGSATGGRVSLSAGERKLVVDVNWLTGVIAVREQSDAET